MDQQQDKLLDMESHSVRPKRKKWQDELYAFQNNTKKDQNYLNLDRKSDSNFLLVIKQFYNSLLFDPKRKIKYCQKCREKNDKNLPLSSVPVLERVILKLFFFYKSPIFTIAFLVLKKLQRYLISISKFIDLNCSSKVTVSAVCWKEFLMLLVFKKYNKKIKKYRGYFYLHVLKNNTSIIRWHQICNQLQTKKAFFSWQVCKVSKVLETAEKDILG